MRRVAATTCVAVLAVVAGGPAVAHGDVLPPQIHTVAGGGTCTGFVISGGPCDNVKATSATIGQARSVALLADGSFLFVDLANDVVRHVTGGTVTTVAGGGTLGLVNNAPVLSGQTTDVDGGSPLASGLDGPVAVAGLPDGSFIITEYNASVIREVSPPTPDAPNGLITTIAGTATPGHTVDAGPATQVALNYPTDAEPQADGSILVADQYNNAVRLLSPPASDGTRTATTVTGNGPGACNDRVSNCDGMPASNVLLNRPVSVSPLSGGGFLIAEYATSTVREVTAGGTFETVAGTPGTAGFAGDGGPATQAELNHPEQVAGLPGGGFLIADTENQRVREVSPSGIIATVAGNGTQSYTGDGAVATAASLNLPDWAIPLADGGALIADGGNGAVRRVTIAPVTTISVSPSTPDSSNGWYRLPPTATIKTTQKAQIRCEIDPLQPPPAYDAIPDGCPLTGSGATISGDGVHTVWAASLNKFGDKELPVSFQVRIDSTPPTITCEGAPVFAVGDPNAAVLATVDDPLSGPATPSVSAPADTSTIGPGTAPLDAASNTGTNTETSCPYLVVPDSFRYPPLLRAHLRPQAHGAALDRLRVTRVAPGATVAVSCTGKGCPFSGRRVVPANRCPRRDPCRRPAIGRTVDAGTLFTHAVLAPGARVLVTVTHPDTWGEGWSLTVPAHGVPTRRSGCLAPGSTVLRATCQRAPNGL